MATCSLDPSEFADLTRLMILAQVDGESSSISGSNSSRISHVNYVDIIIQSHHKVGATATFTIVYFLGLLIFMVNHIDVFVICLVGTLEYCGVDIVWKVGLHNDLIMEVFFQVLGTLVTSMTIIHCKNLNLRPLSIWHLWLLRQGLNNIQYDSNSILICFPHESHMSVGCEGSDHSKPLVGSL
jgi:hypothetical protein